MAHRQHAVRFAGPPSFDHLLARLLEPPVAPSAFLHPFAKPAKAGRDFLSLVGGEVDYDAAL